MSPSTLTGLSDIEALVYTLISTGRNPDFVADAESQHLPGKPKVLSWIFGTKK